jgi:predicted acylesterase/phospholipase RssA
MLSTTEVRMGDVALTGAIADALSRTSIFRHVEPHVVEQLSAAGACARVCAGELVLRRGEAGDAFYVVRSGLLEVLGDDDERRVRLLRAGAPFGELSLLSGRTRAGTVRAVRDSEVWRLPRDAFDAALAEHASFARGMVQALTALFVESARAPTTPAGSPRVFAVVPLYDAPVRAIVDVFVATLGPSCAVCDGAPSGTVDDWGIAVDALERAHDCVVLVASRERDDWYHFCAREADRVLLVARAGTVTAPVYTPRPPDLLVLGDAASGAVTATLRDLRLRAHHLARSEQDRAVARAIRRLAGRSLGLVLSGGGARGAAHIGVLSALDAAGIEVDRFGGTSMGALVGALAAQGRTPAEIERALRVALVDERPFSDYALPRVALIRARRARSMLERFFGDMAIEALAHDFYCVSADLVTAAPVVHRRGPVATAVGASMSLPGIAPPVRDGERLLIDGGVLDGLPVDEMAAANEGPVIAVDVLTRHPPGSSTSSRRRGPALPGILETVARSSTLASRGRADASRRRAALAIVPDLAGIGLLDFAKFDTAVGAGRRAAEAGLSQCPDALPASPEAVIAGSEGEPTWP